MTDTKQQYIDKWMAIGQQTIATTRTLYRRKAAEAAARDFYASQNLPFPDQIEWCDGIASAYRRTAELCEDDNKRPQAQPPVWGTFDAGFWAYFDYATNELGDKETAKHMPLVEVAKHCAWWFPLDEAVVFAELPTRLFLDDEGRPHCEDGPMLQFADGEVTLYYWHGVEMPSWVIEHPEQITIQKIDAEQNAEVRRVMLERFGIDKYMLDSKATLLDDDPRWGKLWRKDLQDDEPIVVVEVLNSTPEPDGSIKTYVLRVPPWKMDERNQPLRDASGEPVPLTSTLEGLAWMAGVSPEAYATELVIET